MGVPPFSRTMRDSSVARCLLLIILALPLLVIFPASGIAATENVNPAETVPGQIILAWDPSLATIPVPKEAVTGLDEDRASRAWQEAKQLLSGLSGLEVVDILPAYGTAVLSVEGGRESTEIERLSRLPWVRYAEPNYIAHAAGYPNDPFIGDQWNLRRVGAPASWDITLGSLSIVVSLVDSGIDLTHPEFAGRILMGYDYVNLDYDPADDYGHGTHVAGIVAAATGNATGIAGLAPNVRILPLKVLNQQGAGTYANIGTAIRRAADSVAQVINVSLGGTSYSQSLCDAVAYAQSKGSLVVAAAGNCALGGSECGGVVNPSYYPAACDGAMAVGATDHLDGWASYSGFKWYVDISAPGGVYSDQIWSTLPGGYGFRYGTSMATPLVAGAAALIWTLQPVYTPAQVASLIQSTADKAGVYAYAAGRNDYYGYGRLNLLRALRWASAPGIQPIAQPPTFHAGGSVSTQQLALTLDNPSDQSVWWEAAVTQGSQWLSISPGSGSTSASVPSQILLEANPALLATGAYIGTVQVTPIYPTSISFDIPVRLEVQTALQRRSYLPLSFTNSVSLSWVDPLQGGEALNLNDSELIQVILPFSYPFYGGRNTLMWVSDNGYVVFGQPATQVGVGQSGCLPSASQPNNAIYVLWQDWKPSLGGQVYTQAVGADKFVVTWYQVRRLAQDTPHTFQLVLNRDGQAFLQYRDVAASPQGTVGVENYDGTVATELMCSTGTSTIQPGSARTLTAVLPW